MERPRVGAPGDADICPGARHMNEEASRFQPSVIQVTPSWRNVFLAAAQPSCSRNKPFPLALSDSRPTESMSILKWWLFTVLSLGSVCFAAIITRRVGWGRFRWRMKEDAGEGKSFPVIACGKTRQEKMTWEEVSCGWRCGRKEMDWQEHDGP